MNKINTAIDDKFRKNNGIKISVFKIMTKLKIPDFKSLEEAAEYWETHSFADYMEDTEPVEIEVCLKGHKIVLEIDYELSDKLTKIARGKKQSCQILLDSWIREKIQQETAS